MIIFLSLHILNVAQSSLLISLAVFRSLATECRRDIALLTPSLVASVEATIYSVISDLEVLARAASVVGLLSVLSSTHLIASVYRMGYLYDWSTNRRR